VTIERGLTSDHPALPASEGHVLPHVRPDGEAHRNVVLDEDAPTRRVQLAGVGPEVLDRSLGVACGKREAGVGESLTHRIATVGRPPIHGEGNGRTMRPDDGVGLLDLCRQFLSGPATGEVARPQE
jgi:hypothetical protein